MASEQVIKTMLAAFAQNWPEKAEHCRAPETISFWLRYLGDMSDDLLKAAGKTVISESHFFPRVADVRETGFRLQSEVAGVPDAYQAWYTVQRWLRLPATVYHNGKQLRRQPLPRIIQLAVDGIGGVDALRLSEDGTADRARFVDAYNSLMGRLQHQAIQLPEVRQLLQATPLPEALKGRLIEQGD